VVGEHPYRIRAEGGLSIRRGTVTVEPVSSSNPLYVHGPLTVADGGHFLQHADGTAFLWLADTWWEGFSRRLTIEQFRGLAARRVEQGFSVVQIVAGLYPEMSPFAIEGNSVSGWPWQEGFTGLNPDWFDEADARVAVLVEQGLVPCIVGAWGSYMRHMGVQNLARHWREIVARWGAYPVVWCLAGEMPAIDTATMLSAAGRLEQGSPSAKEILGLLSRQAALMVRRRGRTVAGFPDSEGIASLLGLRSLVSSQVHAWNEVARALGASDPFGRVVTVHSQPNWAPYKLLEDPALVDLWMLQTGHSGFHSLAPSVDQLLEAVSRRPRKPALVGEVDYEGILGSSGPEMQRFLFWSHLLSGAAGHTYGAQGLWGFNTPEYPCGDGGRWSDMTWQEAAALAGAGHVGLGRRLLLELPWESFQSHPQWVDPHQSAKDRVQPYAAGLPDGPRVIYFPAAGLVRDCLGFHHARLRDLSRKAWLSQFINPRTGIRESTFAVTPDTKGTASLSGDPSATLPSKEDWVLVLASPSPEPKTTGRTLTHALPPHRRIQSPGTPA
jgi:hypothetical protein